MGFWRDPRTGEPTPLLWPLGVAAIVLAFFGKAFLADAMERGVITWTHIGGAFAGLLLVGALIDHFSRPRPAPPRPVRVFTEADAGAAYFAEIREGADGPCHRHSFRITTDALVGERLGKSRGPFEIPRSAMRSIRADGTRFEIVLRDDPLPRILLVAEDDRERLAWELGYRFPEPVAIGLAAAPR